MRFHGVDLEIDGRRSDKTEPDPRFHDDEIYISGIEIDDEEALLFWLNEEFEVIQLKGCMTLRKREIKEGAKDKPESLESIMGKITKQFSSIDAAIKTFIEYQKAEIDNLTAQIRATERR